MYLSKMRGARLLVMGLLLVALAGGMIFPVSVAAAATGTAAVSSATTVPVPGGVTVSVTPTATTKATTAATTKATTATSKATTAPTTAKTSTQATTAPTTTAPTSKATTAPTYEAPAAPSLPAAATVVSAQTIVPGSYTVPAGTGIFTVTPVGNVPVGADGVVQLIVDNGWNPPFGDTYVDISWDPSMVTYESAAIKVLNTTAAVSSDHSVRIMLGDFRRGYPQGRYPLAAITLRAIREGSSSLTVSVDHVRYWTSDFSEFTDITATASGRSGTFSTGALPVESQPIVTFTQNTLAPISYPTNDIDSGGVSTTATTATPTTTQPTTVATVETVATQPLATAVTTALPTTNQTLSAYVSYAPVSTRVQTSGIPVAGVIVVSLAILGGVALLIHRRR
ncbi:MAG TPA: hypothetical protein HA263_02405 [Methanoregulaceae archaeon]|nr:hypothetical protein [Methanoregulaceae archaeon]